MSDVRVGNHHHVQVFGFELRDHAGEIRKGRAIHTERAVVVLKVDVQIDGVGWDAIAAQTGATSSTRACVM